MKRVLFLLLALSAGAAACAQTVPVAASLLQDGNAPACATGFGCTISWVPVLASGKSTVYRKPGGGMATAVAVTAPVYNGAFSIAAMPDSAYTTPTNLCWQVTLTTPKGSTVLGSCVQPSATNYWYAGGVDNFDNWLPSIAPLPTISYVQSVNGCTGACTVSATVSSLGDSDVTGQTASQGSVNLVGTVPQTGKYRISYYLDQNALCTGGSANVLLTFHWTDASSARSVNSLALTLGAVQSAPLGSVQGVVPIYALNASAVTYTSTLTGSCATGGPASYDAHIAVEAVQ